MSGSLPRFESTAGEWFFAISLSIVGFFVGLYECAAACVRPSKKSAEHYQGAPVDKKND